MLIDEGSDYDDAVNAIIARDLRLQRGRSAAPAHGRFSSVNSYDYIVPKLVEKGESAEGRQH